VRCTGNHMPIKVMTVSNVVQFAERMDRCRVFHIEDIRRHVSSLVGFIGAWTDIE